MKILLPLILTLNNPAIPQDTTVIDRKYDIKEIQVVGNLKQSGILSEQAISGTYFSSTRIEKEHIVSTRDISLATPNLFMPDYGSRMTSSIYIRGIGARMEQPSIGLYVDNVPILNKNGYDFDLYDISRIEVLRGPQGTLYGRNTIGGVINLYTLSPFDFQGWKASVSYGNGNTATARVSNYRLKDENTAFSFGLSHHSSDGFFTNKYTGKKSDRILSESGRFRFQKILDSRLSLDNTTSFSYVKQDGFSYSLYDEDTGYVHPVNHNDPCTYDRLVLGNSTTIKFENDLFSLTNSTGYQYLDDKMILDQDFLPVSMFTLKQAQKEHSLTNELVLRSKKETGWQWLTGAFVFYKHVSMEAPVTFKRNGIDELILANANAGIHEGLPHADLLIEEDSFVISSRFKMPTYGAALFHQSTFNLGKWKLTAGLRFDYEHAAMKYDNHTSLHYRLNITMPEYKLLKSEMHGRENLSYYEFLPRVSALYDFKNGNVYGIVSRGYKAGGFNTQIFSDILQNVMMNDMMEDLGVYFTDTDDKFSSASATSYKPEYSWNYELGTHLKFLNNRLRMDASLFYIDCTNQQLTVFPPGKSTGRYMSNAGKTRVYGTEFSSSYLSRNLRLYFSYGYTNARFREFEDGNEDYKDNYVPYAPQNTLYGAAEYTVYQACALFDNVSLRLDWRGTGKMYWNESNSLTQGFYGLLGANLSFVKNKFVLDIWGKNITDRRYNTFYFKSVGNSFVQRGKPAIYGATLSITI